MDVCRQIPLLDKTIDETPAIQNRQLRACTHAQPHFRLLSVVAVTVMRIVVLVLILAVRVSVSMAVRVAVRVAAHRPHAAHCAHTTTTTTAVRVAVAAAAGGVAATLLKLSADMLWHGLLFGPMAGLLLADEGCDGSRNGGRVAVQHAQRAAEVLWAIYGCRLDLAALRVQLQDLGAVALGDERQHAPPLLLRQPRLALRPRRAALQQVALVGRVEAVSMLALATPSTAQMHRAAAADKTHLGEDRGDKAGRAVGATSCSCGQRRVGPVERLSKRQGRLAHAEQSDAAHALREVGGQLHGKLGAEPALGDNVHAGHAQRLEHASQQP
eukprot:m.177014 g.177014  ORF g.177014 m.177014 type:complete len:327 (-) comp17373_c1_seq3:3180-4160(-)